ncbi:MAG TPA: DUF4388 domain-containing protein [Ktedonobacterales bacterium]|nr:DUF4388 domain-containing protein [Ktedonobacterales bacterium]
MANGSEFSSSLNGSFNGSLSEFRLEELLQMMGLGQSTGALYLHQEEGRTGLIYFDSGSLVSCSELDTEALTLGHVLQQLDYASATQIEHAFQQQTQDPLGKRIGERLIDLNMLTQDQLNHALKTQTLWTARELSRWDRGTYGFHPDEAPPPDATMLRIDTTRAVMEVLRYQHEWESLGPYLTDGMRTRLIMAFEPPIGHPLIFHAQAWRVISRVNSQHTVRRIATSLHLPEIDVARMVGPLVQEGLLVPVGAAGGPGLPEEAARLSMHNFDLFTLLIGMEQDWLKRKTPADQLIALAGFVNATMQTLGESCQSSGLSLAPETLSTILSRERLVGIGEYRFRIENNRLDVDDFATYCRRVIDGSSRNAMGATKPFYDAAYEVLHSALRASFQAINTRIASPIERAQNQEAWEALFLTFQGEPTTTV